MPKKTDAPVPLVAACLVVLLGLTPLAALAGKLPRSYRRDDSRPVTLRDQSPVVRMSVVKHRNTGGMREIRVRAILDGAPMPGTDWLCLQAEWWQESQHRGKAPEKNEYCGAVAEDRSFEHTFYLMGGPESVYVALWNKAGKQVASGDTRLIGPEVN